MTIIAMLLINISQAKELSFEFKWEKVPTVEICPDANIGESDVMAAIKYWESEGQTFKVADIKYVEYCNDSSKSVIQIMGDRNVESYEYARTVIDWYYYGQKNKNTVYYMRRAKVQIPEKTKEKIIFHEIGHAFGLGHSQHDVMYAYH